MSFSIWITYKAFVKKIINLFQMVVSFLEVNTLYFMDMDVARVQSWPCGIFRGTMEVIIIFRIEKWLFYHKMWNSVASILDNGKDMQTKRTFKNECYRFGMKLLSIFLFILILFWVLFIYFYKLCFFFKFYEIRIMINKKKMFFYLLP